MVLDEKRMAELLSYCHISDSEADSEDRTLLKNLYNSAVAYMTQAGISEPADGTARRSQYDLCINYMVLDGYDRRDMSITGTIVSENPAFFRNIIQLQATEPVPNSGTSR